MSKKVVALGGGTGQGNMLGGLKKFTDKITAIVTVADDGGGSGLIRNENRMLPPGDIRNCLVALADMDPLTEKLIRHRFESGSIKNQSFGNLLILAYYEIFGDFEKSINYVGESIGAKGKVVPSTREHIRLVANLENENVAIGESNIAAMAVAQKTEIKSLELLPTAPKATNSAIAAIADADVIVIGPGSLYTSIIANLLIPEIAQAIIDSPAKKVFICNIMSEHGETDNLDAWGHFEKIRKHIPHLTVDYILINDGKIVGEVQQQYESDNKYQIMYDESQREKFESIGIQVIVGDYVRITDIGHIVHDSIKVSEEIMKL
ncbi:MAG: uridine diphosphate-N-acetylglucosamine-binding protein YvcK [Peptostreptococcaceae bacterium]|nr:uridine diphosphate-N-acetylglucosamine-binding protein YvcK [Peptostreptococcaceae bacterium]